MDFIEQRIKKNVDTILSLPYLSKKTVFIADLLLVAAIFTVSSSICYSLVNQALNFILFGENLILCLFLSGLFFYLFATYRGILRYSSFRDSLRIFLSLLCANLALLAIMLLFRSDFTLSAATVFINFILGFSVIIFFRMMVRLFFDYVKSIYTGQKNVPLLVFGTGLTQISLAKMIRDNEHLPYAVAGFITSEARHHTNQKILNVPIYNKSDFYSKPALFPHIRAVLIVPEELKVDEKQLLVEKCMQYKIDLLSAPSPEYWKTGNKKIQKINKVRIEDLLGRPQNHVNTESIEKELKGKTVLITGAAGSIGSEIARQICRLDAKMLLLCDIAESPLHQLSLELNDNCSGIKKQLLIADVRNFERMKSIFEQYRPQFIYHAAAYKHVPLMEEQPSEAVLANVLGTKNVADLAVKYQSECFVMISTDKAVNPSSIMGTSKRIAEIYIQYLVHQQQAVNREKQPLRFITTRFGNVLGSNGSVIPRFEKQIEQGGPITVTHPDIIRYFMTISEACNLVLEASSIGQGGEIFVFDMGESVKITSMAEAMIRLSGLEPYKDINIIFTGLRPGEKLFEELLYDKEKELPTRHEKIMISRLTECNYNETIPLLFRLIEISARNDNQQNIVKLMKEIVPEFISQNSVYSLPDDEN